MTLALHGGERVRRLPFPPRLPYGLAERNVAYEVVATGQLSGFLAEPGESFLGGPRVRELEAAWASAFGVPHAVAMNSGTSCLFAAVQALGIGPGDEVIVSPWTMSASVACVVGAGAIPVFADIEPDTFCLDPDSVRQRITARTRAIVVVDLFGCPAQLGALRALALSHEIPIIEDAAQAIGARLINRWAGTLGDVGVFSLNRHKTIQCGEGGIAVTRDADVAERLRQIRNHGETTGALVVGQNYRMGEVEAAIARVQLGRLQELTEPRIRNAERLTAALSELDGISTPVVPEDGRHVYYLYAVRVQEKQPGMFLRALMAEGIPATRYVKPLYHLPLYGGPHFKVWHPETERAYREVLVLDLIYAGMTDEDVDDVLKAFRKVHEHRGEI